MIIHWVSKWHTEYDVNVLQLVGIYISSPIRVITSLQ